MESVFIILEKRKNELGLSWYKICKLINESESRINTMRNKKSKINFNVICKIAVVLNLDLNELNPYQNKEDFKNE